MHGQGGATVLLLLRRRRSEGWCKGPVGARAAAALERGLSGSQRRGGLTAGAGTAAASWRSPRANPPPRPAPLHPHLRLGERALCRRGVGGDEQRGEAREVARQHARAAPGAGEVAA